MTPTPGRRPLTPLEIALLPNTCPNRGWTQQHASEFYHCNTCGLTAHWMDLRPHSVTAKAEQVELDRRIADAMRRSHEEMFERIRYWRGECPAEDPLPHDRWGFRLAGPACDLTAVLAEVEGEEVREWDEKA